MQAPPIPHNEHVRLLALKALDVLDRPPDPTLDALTTLAAEVCNTPVSLVSLVDENRQWFASNVGFPLSETERRLAFCAHAINDEATLEVSDAMRDPRFADNPLVTGTPHIRFYAGAPLKTPDGLCLGTLCVIDSVPRELRPEQRHCLEVLARAATGALELRSRTAALSRALLAEQRAMEEKSWVCSYVVHEIRNMLTVLEGSFELLERVPLPPTQTVALTMARKSAETMQNLARDVLDLARAQAGRLPIASVPFALSERVHEVAAYYAPLLERRGIVLNTVIDPGLPARVVGDPQRLAQALHNLLGNATKFTQEGSIRVEALRGQKADSKQTFKLCVSDTGPGLSKEARDRLFQPYLGVGSGERTGSGLGLYITRQIVELMGGTIDVTGAPGQGAIFCIELPLIPAS